MDATLAEALARLLSNLHEKNVNTIRTNRALNKYRALKKSEADRYGINFGYAEEREQVLLSKMIGFLQEPRRNNFDGYLLVHIAADTGWLKLLRFVVVEDRLNVETIFLKGTALEEIKSFGYRYEHPEQFPEGEDGADKHAFFHIQPITNSSYAGPLIGCEKWRSDEFPAFFMFASCAYELVLYAVHSLIGWEELVEHKVRNGIDNPVLNRLLLIRGDAYRSFQHDCG